jgi:hypothetical protein
MPKILKKEPEIRFVDVVFGAGGKGNTKREHSLYRHLLETQWSGYCAIDQQFKEEKAEYLKTNIIDPILKEKGRFLQVKKNQWLQLDYGNDGDRKEIVKKIMQACRDVKKANKLPSPLSDIAAMKVEALTKKRAIAEDAAISSVSPAKKRKKTKNGPSEHKVERKKETKTEASDNAENFTDPLATLEPLPIDSSDDFSGECWMFDFMGTKEELEADFETLWKNIQEDQFKDEDPSSFSLVDACRHNLEQGASSLFAC